VLVVPVEGMSIPIMFILELVWAFSE
jgi:hypothetical protein